MTKLLKTAAIAAIITGFANSAQAFELFTTLDAPTAAYELVDSALPNHLPRDVAKPALELKSDTKIGVARLDGGRLIPTPFGEEFDWELLSRRTAKTSGATIEVMNTGDYLKYIPEIPFHGIDTDNKIDEIRLTAANEGYSHVIIYGLGTDAYWASFGGKALERTGLKVDADCASWDGAKAKALIVDSFTGKVLGAATADDITHNIGKLADDVERVMTELTRA